MNTFDIVIAVITLIAIGFGFNAGLLRSAATILGYLVAMPIAVWATSLIAPQLGSSLLTQNSTVFFGCFLLSGVVLGSLLRTAVNDAIGADIGIADRLGGALLGAVRVLLIAVTVVLIFDELIPPSAQPSYLVGSRLRPLLSTLGQKGFKSLPPDVVAYIDQLKRTRRI
jgi:membrane protein required for colicin V production